ncbi:MAG: TPM domain-containing protein [Xanthobacteraceae bacterium]
MTLGVFVALCFTSWAFAFDFPALTGRVVDQAGVMSAESKSDIEAKAKTLEDKSGIQLVVATVKSLQGGDVETYANELFRFWKLGEAKKNNGVLLLVAPNERKVRIEVGYGLEGTLTDALSSVIISSAIIPRFKTKDYSGGIERGVDGIISVLSGDSAEWQPKVNVRTEDASSDFDKLFPILFFAIMIFIIWYLIRHAGGPPSGGAGRRGSGGPIFIPYGGGGWGGGGGGGGGGFGGGFSGGGGWSGGGGASGSW